jgi:hypothetical protein
LTYPVLAPPPGLDIDARFRPEDAARNAGPLPILLTRVGRERPEIAATVQAFTAEADIHEAADGYRRPARPAQLRHPRP